VRLGLRLRDSGTVDLSGFVVAEAHFSSLLYINLQVIRPVCVEDILWQDVAVSDRQSQ
jgi:hypothetical protein